MKTVVLIFSLAALAFTTPGCTLLNALDTYHYVGIYEASYQGAGVEKGEWPSKFDQFCEALRKETSLEVKDVSRDVYSKSALLVLTGAAAKTLNRVVISESSLSDQDKELSLNIIKVPVGENPETVELKRHIERALEAVGLRKWRFYIQRSHGQIWNS